jgi:hypothetical protein
MVNKLFNAGTARQSGFFHPVMPDLAGLTPVIIATREGAHAGDGICALVNDMDIFLSLSKLGVFNPGNPPSSRGLIQSLRSSIAMKMMLGLELEFGDLAHANPEFAITKKITLVKSVILNLLRILFTEKFFIMTSYIKHSFPNVLSPKIIKY